MSPEAVCATVRQQLSSVVAGRAVVMAASHLVADGSILAHLRELGAGTMLVVGSPAFQAIAEQAGARFVLVDPGGDDSVVLRRRWEAMLDDPPDTVRQEVERHDPDGTAVVLLSPWFERTTFLGRAAFGAQQPRWAVYEDKLMADELWTRAGIPHVTSRTAPLDLSALIEVADELDEGAGTVWAGDALEGVHSGAHAVRWVQNGADAAAAVEAYTGHHSHVRVMPFLEGQPCGIHGIVLPDGVAALRPVEHVVLRTATEGRLRPAGAGTSWDPPAADREQMREAVRHVGAALRALAGFRGSFCIDGVLTRNGFRPTECNPRWGAALNYLHTASPDFPTLLTHHAVSAGQAIGASCQDLEGALVDAADRRRRATAWAQLSRPWPALASHRLRVHDDGTWSAAEAAEPAAAVLTVNPSATRGSVSLTFDPLQLPLGAAVGPRIASAFAWADHALGTDIGPMAAPPDTRGTTG